MSMCDGELGILWLCDANYGYVCEIWEIIGYEDMMSFVAIYETYVEYHVMLRNVCHDIVKAC